MWAHLAPCCGQWCIAWQLTDEALTFYSRPCGQFSASWNCGGLHPLTLECSDELWPCGRIIKRSGDSEPRRRREDESGVGVGRGEMDAPWNQRLPHDPSLRSASTFRLIPSHSQLRPLIVSTMQLFVQVCFFVVFFWLILSLGALRCIVSPEFLPRAGKIYCGTFRAVEV